MSDANRCHRCKASLAGAKVVPQSNYALVFCPRCGEVNERGDDDDAILDIATGGKHE